MDRVLLVNMPFGALDRQSIGLSLLKAELLQKGIHSDVLYLSFTFAEFIGAGDYSAIQCQMPPTAFSGEWVFTEALYGPRPDIDNSYMSDVLTKVWHLDTREIRALLNARAHAARFLKYCMDTIQFENYTVVGFTSTFEQNIASLALAKQIKDRYLEIAIVFGGANWESPMGVELHRRFPFVDFVCTGEADRSFPLLSKAIISGTCDSRTLKNIAGIVYRSGNKTYESGPAEVVHNLDELPIPDYSDYFLQLNQFTDNSGVVPSMMFESSRGCWWGQRSHCTFCGLNGGAIGYRSKSPVRAYQELVTLVRKWQPPIVVATDSILNMKYFSSFLPALSSHRLPCNLMYEVKANLNRQHVKMLADAGIKRIQPGIESMNDNLLSLMRKGTTALKNIQLLKWCHEYGVEVDWNILYGFPAETKQDYDSMLSMFPAIQFLGPPSACGPISLDRFSPHFNDTVGFGFRNIKPLPTYKYLYPFSEESLNLTSYYFEYGYAKDRSIDGPAAAVIGYIEKWRNNPETGALSAYDYGEDTLIIQDNRRCSVQAEYRLEGWQRLAYEFCDSVHNAKDIMSRINQSPPWLGPDKIMEFLTAMLDNKLMLENNGKYLSLCLHAAPRDNITNGDLVISKRIRTGDRFS